MGNVVHDGAFPAHRFDSKRRSRIGRWLSVVRQRNLRRFLKWNPTDFGLAARGLREPLDVLHRDSAPIFVRKTKRRGHDAHNNGGTQEKRRAVSGTAPDLRRWCWERDNAILNDLDFR